jgi:TolB protein
MSWSTKRCAHPFQQTRRVVLLCLVCLLASPLYAAAQGEFAPGVDVGKVELPGKVQVLPSKAGYRITASGANIWNTEDAFHFVARKITGDLAFSMDIEWEGVGKAKHRKAGPMVRQSLDADAVNVGASVHGDGLINLHYRKTKGGVTIGVPTPVKAPATVKLERDGNVFTVSLAPKGKPFQPVGSVTVELSDPVYAGMAVCSHNAKELETAIITNVSFTNRVPGPNEKRILEASLEVVNAETGERRILYRARDPFQAPNWSPDGKTLFLNQRSRMYTIQAEGGKLQLLDTGAAIGCNNDHGLSPDGKWLAISSGHEKKGSKIYIVPAAGGGPRLVTPMGPSYWHGWSPDGKTLAYCAKRGDEMDIYTIPAEGGEEKRLTTAVGLDDGPEYTPDGKYIYFNSERTGVMKIWRMRPDGSSQEQVTNDANYADWFPHPSPDGKMLVFLSYDKSVKGHPANKDVVLRIMPLAGGKPKVLATLFGGQGTINVPSWSPDSKFIAFASYRMVLPDAPPEGFRPLFDGKTLAGWQAKPRVQSAKPPKGTDKGDSFYERSLKSRGRWTVRDGVLIGEQDPPGSGLGGYLVSDEAFGDFELLIDGKPDWAVDTGVLVRTTPAGNVGFQILIDHRKDGGIGGFYGNGLGNFHALPYCFRAVTDDKGRPIGLKEADPSKAFQPVTDEKRRLLAYAAPVDVFLKTWKFGDWNTFKIRCEGELPHLTTWINGSKICELNTATMKHPGFDKKAVAALLGNRGHISLEVHSNGPKDGLGKERWAPGAVCRWRNIFVKPLAK